MNKLYKLFVTLTIVAAISGASIARASSISATTITQIIAVTGTTSYVAIFFPTNIPSNTCAVKTAMYVDTATAKGKAILSLATAAMLAHTQVDALGTGTCVTPAGAPFNAESINQFGVHAP